jgi:hypothetical protein
MSQPRIPSLALAVTLALLCAAPVLRADEDDERNELVVFGGISLLDATRSSQTTFDGDIVVLPGLRFRGGFVPPPFEFPGVSLETETSLGSSALFGARYSRLIKDRLALEADLTIAPSHELETRGLGCLGAVCVSGDGRNLDGRFGRGFGERNVTAWHYGAGLAYELTGGDVRPLLLLGAGGATWDGAGETATDFVLRFGAGLKILFGRMGARVDVIDHLVLDHATSGDTEHDVHVSAGLLVRF